MVDFASDFAAGPGGGSLADVPVWLAEAEPAAPSALDDYFIGATLDPKWTEWDHGAVMTASIVQSLRCVQLAATGDGTDRWAGIVQPVPGAEFAAYARLDLNAPLANFHNVGLAVFQDATSATGDFETVEMFMSSTLGGWITRGWTQWNGTSTARTTITPSPDVGLYACMRLNGTSCSVDVSTNGRSWIQIASTTLGYTPLHVGLVHNAVQNLATSYALFPFFHVRSGAGTSVRNATTLPRVVYVAGDPP